MEIIGKINVDFQVINSYDPKVLIVADSSTWLNADNLPSYISITPPGSKQAITHIFQKHRMNIFNSVNLGLTCLTECGEQNYVDLNDGIWTINLKSSFQGIEKTRYYLKSDKMRLTLDQAYIKASLEYDQKDRQLREDLEDIEFLLRTSEAFTRDGNYTKASRNFSDAQEILRKYIECKNCL